MIERKLSSIIYELERYRTLNNEDVDAVVTALKLVCDGPSNQKDEPTKFVTKEEFQEYKDKTGRLISELIERNRVQGRLG